MIYVKDSESKAALIKMFAYLGGLTKHPTTKQNLQALSTSVQVEPYRGNVWSFNEDEALEADTAPTEPVKKEPVKEGIAPKPVVVEGDGTPRVGTPVDPASERKSDGTAQSVVDALKQEVSEAKEAKKWWQK